MNCCCSHAHIFPNGGETPHHSLIDSGDIFSFDHRYEDLQLQKSRIWCTLRNSENLLETDNSSLMLCFLCLQAFFLSQRGCVCVCAKHESMHRYTYVCGRDWKLFSFKVYLHFSCKKPHSFQETFQVIGDLERVKYL